MQAGQIGEEFLDLFGARQVRWQVAQGFDIATKPQDIGVFGGQGLVLAADDLAHPLDGIGSIHIRGEV